jgi:Mannosyl-glycoprotein endo-beta-N-acetylglucosaminidase/LysM domain
MCDARHIKHTDKLADVLNMTNTRNLIRKSLAVSALTAVGWGGISAGSSWSAEGPSSYQVRKGDTIKSVSLDYDVPVSLTLAWNPEVSSKTYLIHPGQTLRFPSIKCLRSMSTVPITPPTTHNVPTVPPRNPSNVTLYGPYVQLSNITPACSRPPAVKVSKTINLSNLTPKQQRILTKMPKKKQSCLAKLIPAVEAVARQYDINPAVMVAQAIQETGHCRAVPGNGYWGIKGKSKTGKSVKFTTHENFKRGRVKMVDTFRAYDSVQESAIGYAEVIEGKKQFSDATPFTEPTAEEAKQYLLQLQDGNLKYATDPKYVGSVMSAIEDNNVIALLTPEFPLLPEVLVPTAP